MDEINSENDFVIDVIQSDSLNEYDIETSIEIIEAGAQNENLVQESASNGSETVNANNANAVSNQIASTVRQNACVEANVEIKDVNAKVVDVLELEALEIESAVTHNVDETVEPKNGSSQDSIKNEEDISSLNEMSIEIIEWNIQNEKRIDELETDPLSTDEANIANAASNQIGSKARENACDEANVELKDVNANFVDVLELKALEIEPAGTHNVDEAVEPKNESSKDSVKIKENTPSLNGTAEYYTDDSDVVEVMAYFLEESTTNHSEQ